MRCNLRSGGVSAPLSITCVDHRLRGWFVSAVWILRYVIIKRFCCCLALVFLGEDRGDIARVADNWATLEKGADKRDDDSGPCARVLASNAASACGVDLRVYRITSG